MVGFTGFLLEQGIETQLPISLGETLETLEQTVPRFEHAGRGYLLAAVTRGRLGSRWELAVKVTDPATGQPISDQPVGSVNVTRLDQYLTELVIPPRTPDGGIDATHFDGEGQYFGAFIFQLLNALVERDLMELPGAMPRFA